MSSLFATRILIVCTLATFGVGLAACKQGVQFTKAPVYGPPPPSAPRREISAIAVATPLDLAGPRRAADEAMPAKLPRIVDWITNATCAKRTRWVECAGARVDIEIERKGETRITLSQGLLHVEVPLAYEVTSRGLGWARHVTETRTGEVTATVAIEARLTGDYEPEARVRDEIRLSEAAIAALRGKVALEPHIAPRLRRAAAPIAEAVRRELAEARVKLETERAWAALHAPIEFNCDAQVWLRAEPERVHSAGFVERGGTVAWHMLVVARLATFTGQRPPPLIPKPLPEPQRESVEDLRARVLLPAIITADPLIDAIREAFPPAEIIRTADGPDLPPLAVCVRGDELNPARGLLAVELQLEVTEVGQWQGLIGPAHFVGRPVFRPQSSTIELEGVAFPDRPPSRQRLPASHLPTSERDRRVNVAIEGVRGPRIGLEPFASRISRAARLDVTRLLRDVLPHANSLLGQHIAAGLVLTGRFDQVQISGVAPTRAGLEITFELAGALAIEAAPRAAANFTTIIGRKPE
jgi:hypothetical protein